MKVIKEYKILTMDNGSVTLVTKLNDGTAYVVENINIQDALNHLACVESQALYESETPKTKSLEVNGPANIVMMLDMYQDEIKPEAASKLRFEAMKTIEYMRQVKALETPFWYDIKIKKGA
jgi:hypothetical protein